jgi:hypothetical protein
MQCDKADQDRIPEDEISVLSAANCLKLLRR